MGQATENNDGKEKTMYTPWLGRSRDRSCAPQRPARLKWMHLYLQRLAEGGCFVAYPVNYSCTLLLCLRGECGMRTRVVIL